MTSVGGATAIMAESVTKNVKKCSKRKTASQVIEDDDGKKTSALMGSTCPLMSGYKFGPNTSEGQKIEIVLRNNELSVLLVHQNSSSEKCLILCQDSAQCLGYSFSEANGLCGLYSGFERFELMDGHWSGRKCTNCELREWVKVRKLSKLRWKLYFYAIRW